MQNISNIRMAKEPDAANIASINALSWQKAYRGIFPDDMLDSISVEKWSLAWKHQLQNNALILLACQDNEVVGFAQICKEKSAGLSSRQGEINAIYLHPHAWRKGIGRELCLASLAKLRDLGFNDAVVWVLSGNYRARTFYQSLGFEASGRSRGFNASPGVMLDEIQYIKSL